MSLYELVAGLDVEIDGLRLEQRELEVSSGFTRVTTTIVLTGAGVEGRGEDVTYDAVDHEDVPEPDLRGRSSFADLSARLDALELFSTPAQRPASGDYRRWGFESAALDLALRQAGISLGEAVGRPYRPVRFVVSTRLDIRPWLALDPALEFKLDPTSDWDSGDDGRHRGDGQRARARLQGVLHGNDRRPGAGRRALPGGRWSCSRPRFSRMWLSPTRPGQRSMARSSGSRGTRRSIRWPTSTRSRCRHAS